MKTTTSISRQSNYRMSVTAKLSLSCILWSSRAKTEMIRMLQELVPRLRSIAVLTGGLLLGANVTTLLYGTDILRAAQSQVPILRVEVDLHSIDFRVTDKQGHDVRG